MRSGLWFTGISAVVTAAVGLLGSGLVAAPARAGVWAGAVLAFAFQTVAFWALFVGFFPRRRLVAHLLGMLGRFAVFGVAALVWVPLWGLPPAPTLFALVTVFFATTLVESVFVQPTKL